MFFSFASAGGYRVEDWLSGAILVRAIDVDEGCKCRVSFLTTDLYYYALSRIHKCGTALRGIVNGVLWYHYSLD